MAEDWDETAGISPHHLSYIITTLLPKRLVTLDQEHNTESQLIEFCQKNGITNAVAVGSSSEGFNIPHSMTIEEQCHLDTYSDADILFVENEFHINSTDSTEQKSDCDAFLESTEVHPGYTRVRLSSKNKQEQDVVSLGNKTYLNGRAIQNQRCENMTGRMKTDDEGQVLTHGPAVSVEYSTVLSAENIERHGLRTSLEIVLALPVKQWPPEANDWAQRVKEINWLEDLVDSIISEGCHVVPVAHKYSLHPDIEWRLSFVTTEKQIARLAITDDYDAVSVS